MGDIPVLLSKEQIFGNLIDSIRARLRSNIDLNDGSTITQVVEAITQGLFKASANQIAMIDAASTDRAQGEALQRQANDANVPIYPAFSSYGSVTITDLTFQVISSNIYAGQPAAVAGSLTIYVADASLFPAAGGQLYIGRGTINVEGPLAYTATTAQAGGAYWSITLAGTSPTTKFHNIGETVILAQGGNRFIPSGTTVQTPQGSSITAVLFSTTSGATILDGAVTVSAVPVICNAVGTVGNVSIGAIQQIVGVPFNASVNNPLAFNNGSNADTDDQIRDRIKAYELAKSKGTPQAIEAAADGVIALDELKQVTSTSYMTFGDGSAALIFGDGTGYEPLFVGAPYESVIASALGGEMNAQLRNVPIAQARVQCSVAAPYPLPAGGFLACTVDGTETIHQFVLSDFQVPSAATAVEVAASINGDPNLNWSASTAENQTFVVVYPRDKDSDNIQVNTPSISPNANLALGFSLVQVFTLGLFKNNLPLYEEGLTATLTTRQQATWSSSIAAGDTLIYSVDGTPPITTTFTLSAFQAIAIGATVSASTPIATWAAVMNSLMPGVVAQVLDDTITLSSSRGAANGASLEIIGGTLSALIFPTGATLSATGQQSDYTLNVWTGQIGFTDVLIVGDQITAGSQYTRGNSLTNQMPSGPGVAGRLWVITDGAVEPIPNGLAANTNITFTKVGSELTISGLSPALVPTGFSLAQPGDWLIVWANPSDPAPLISNQGFWRIQTVTTGTIVVDDGTTVRTNLGIGFIPSVTRIVLVRSDAPVQLLSYPAAPLVTFFEYLNANLVGIASDIEGSAIRISTNTFDNDGQIYFAAADQGGSALGLPIGEVFSNVTAYYGYVSQTDAEAGAPSFTYSALGNAISDEIFDVAGYEALGGQFDDFLQILDGYTAGSYPAPLPVIIPNSNFGQRSFVTEWNPANSQITLLPPIYMQTTESIMNQGDRFFLRTSYKFDARDSASVIVDDNAQTNQYPLPVSRTLTVSAVTTPTTQNFSATDAQSSLALSSPASFYNFDFSNFRMHRQARTILTDGVYSLQVLDYDYGPQGDRMRVGLFYPPSVTNTTLSSNFTVSDVIDCMIYLPVTTARTPNWDFTTSFTVSVVTVGATDEVTYTYQAGTQPNFVTAGVTVGDIAFISGSSDLLAQDEGIQGRVTGVAPTSFTITIPTGIAVPDALTFTAFQNLSGTISVTTNAPHNLSNGDIVGFYNTASPNGGSSYPFNTTYTVTVTGPSSFNVPTPLSAPGTTILSASQVSNVVTITTTLPNNLSVGDVILVSGAGSPYNGYAAVSAVQSANSFQYIKAGSAASVATGRFDFQSFGPGPVSSISTISASGGLVTVNTVAANTLAPGNIVTIAGVATAAWSSVTTYPVNEVISYLGNNYISLQAGNLDNVPSSAPTYWAVTTLNFGGTFIVNSTPLTTQFTYYYQGLGLQTGTGGTAVEQIAIGALASAIGGTGNTNLQFGSVAGTTAQQIATYASTNLPSQLVINVIGSPSAVITTSTADIPGNYYDVTVTSFHTYLSSRRAKVQLSSNIPAGATITISGMTGVPAAYNGQYVVLKTYLDTFFGYIVSDIVLESLATATAGYTPGGTVTGYLAMQMMCDGENVVLSSDIQALSPTPMFNAKNTWVSAPAIGENIKLVATTSERLVGFWNNLVVTGFTNVGDAELTRYGREIQLSTNTFGGSGSVQVSGGSANSLSVALIGSAQEVTTKIGEFQIPYTLRIGMMPRMWINLINNVAQNKQLQFADSTSILLTGTTAHITAGAGTFQTARTKSHDATTEFRVENHGAFLAIIGIGGSSMGLITNCIQEGDWVRLVDTLETPWASTNTYALGARVSYNTGNYTSLVNGNIGNEPDTSPADWLQEEWNSANLGVYQVIRTFGQDAFWVINPNAVEEVLTLGNINNLTFYTYDSVMPGDIFVITTTAFDSQLATAWVSTDSYVIGNLVSYNSLNYIAIAPSTNQNPSTSSGFWLVQSNGTNAGQYTVVDDSFGPAYGFPTASTIWFNPAIPNPGPNSVLLGGEYIQVNVQEKTPLSLYKRIWAVGPANGNYQTILVDSPNLVNRITSSLGASAVAQDKLGFETSINYGINAYNYYEGLIAQLTKVIYGDPADVTNYPGIRAGGTDISIIPAVLRAITASFGIRINSGVPFTEIVTYVQSAIAGYVNNLPVGQPVSISGMIAAAMTVTGVVSVVVNSPIYAAGSDQIPVGANEQAFVIDPTSDLTISLVT